MSCRNINKNKKKTESDSLTQSQWKCYVCYNIHKFIRLLMLLVVVHVYGMDEKYKADEV